MSCRLCGLGFDWYAGCLGLRLSLLEILWRHLVHMPWCSAMGGALRRAVLCECRHGWRVDVGSRATIRTRFATDRCEARCASVRPVLVLAGVCWRA
jgi:hypothetical protein